MLLFTTFIILSIQVSNAESPHSHYFNHGRDKPSSQDWSPFEAATTENFNLLPDLPPIQPTPQYSSHWLPIGNIDDHNAGYRPEASRFTDYQASPPFRHTPSVQHSAPPVQRTPPPFQHNAPPVQHTAPPVQHIPPPVQHNPTPGPIPTQPFNRFPTSPTYDPNIQNNHNPFGGAQHETNQQFLGFNQHQSDNNVHRLPSSYDAPLYAPLYEPGPNEDYRQVIDWASFANAFGYPPSAPQPQRPPNHRYKIVFIKTPRIPGFQPPTTPPPPPDQEKTLIYVLVNRPDYDAATTAAPPPSTTPSKPEVYFIQYKTKSNQSQIGNPIQSGNVGDPSLYGDQDMNQHRYGSTISKSVKHGNPL